MHHICALHIFVLIVLFISMYVLFASSRVDTDTEQFEKEFLYITPEDRVRVFSSDLTGEPTPSPILHFHALLIYCYPYVAILSCHVSYSTCYLYIRVTPPRPTYCLLFASFASHSALLGICCYLFIRWVCWVVG